MHDRLMRVVEVERLTGLSRSTLYRRIRGEGFPAPIDVGGRSVRWSQAAVLTWIEGRKESGRE